jgi:hypothetical protein
MTATLTPARSNSQQEDELLRTALGISDIAYWES